MTPLGGILMFLSSYAPLALVLGLLDSFGRGTPTVVCYIVAAVGVLVVPTVFRATAHIAARPLVYVTSAPKDADVMAYIASYLVPFSAVTATTARERVALGIFIGLLGVLFIRAEMSYVNPLLAVFGWRIFQLQSAAGTPMVLLCKRRFMTPNGEVQARRISDYVWIEEK